MSGNEPFVVDLPRSLISWDLFVRAQGAWTQTGRSERYKSFVAGKLFCECGSAMVQGKPGERHHLAYCPESHGKRYKLAEIERVVLRETAKRLANLTGDFFAAANQRLEHLQLAHTSRRAKVVAEIADVNQQIKDRYRNLTLMDPRAIEIGNELVKELLDKRDILELRLANMEQLPALVVDGIDAAAQMQTELSDLGREFPIMQDTPDDERVLKKLEDYITRVRILEADDDLFDIEIEFNDISGEDAVVSAVVATEQNVGVRGHNQAEMREHVAHLIASSKIRLTDAEWAGLDQVGGYRGKARRVRDAVDAVLLWNESDISTARFMQAMGHETMFARSVSNRLAQIRRTIVPYLRRTRGPDFDIRLPLPARTGSEAMRLRSIEHPVFLLRLCQEHSGFEALDDTQWTAIAPLLPTPRARGKKAGYRVALDQYFGLLRTEFGITQSVLAGCSEWHASLVLRLHESDRFNCIVQTLLELEGYQLPSDYRMPTRPDGLLDKHAILPADQLMLKLTSKFEHQDAALPITVVNTKLQAGRIVIDVNRLTVTTIDGAIIPMTDRYAKLLLHFFQNPEVAVSHEEIGRIVSSRGFTPKTNSIQSVIYTLRKMLREHCREVELGIVTLKDRTAYMSTSKPITLTGELAAQPAVPYVAPKGPTTLILAIVNALTDVGNLAERMADLDFLLGSDQDRLRYMSNLPTRIKKINLQLKRVYPHSKNPILNLCRAHRSYDGLHRVRFEPTQLGKRVRHALGMPPIPKTS